MTQTLQESVLELKELVFDEIHFVRHGFKNENKPSFTLGIAIEENKKDDMYRVVLQLEGKKEKEFSSQITMSGYFAFRACNDYSEEDKKEMINRNAVAILMPYLRSELSILTAQPNTDSIVLPPFNINSLFDK